MNGVETRKVLDALKELGLPPTFHTIPPGHDEHPKKAGETHGDKVFLKFTDKLPPGKVKLNGSSHEITYRNALMKLLPDMTIREDGILVSKTPTDAAAGNEINNSRDGVSPDPAPAPDSEAEGEAVDASPNADTPPEPPASDNKRRFAVGQRVRLLENLSVDGERAPVRSTEGEVVKLSSIHAGFYHVLFDGWKESWEVEWDELAPSPLPDDWVIGSKPGGAPYTVGELRAEPAAIPTAPPARPRIETIEQRWIVGANEQRTKADAALNADGIKVLNVAAAINTETLEYVRVVTLERAA